MGPILFTLYVSHLFNIISQHLPSVHGYADYTQIYLSLILTLLYPFRN